MRGKTGKAPRIRYRHAFKIKKKKKKFSQRRPKVVIIYFLMGKSGYKFRRKKLDYEISLLS